MGNVTALVDGVAIALGRRHERQLLGLLLLETRRVIPVDRLVAMLWEGDPPQAAHRTVQTYISRLRARLEPHGVHPVRQGSGYLIDADPETIDAHCFAAAIAQARTLPTPAKVESLREALALWRGPVLADADNRLRQRVGAALDELHQSALELLAEAQLASGQHRQAMADLAGPVAVHGTRESLVELMMLALYRSGRRGEALVLYRQCRDLLAEELGVEPGASIQQLHKRILNGDPALDQSPAEQVRARWQLLPHDIADFTGRDGELACLDVLAAQNPVIAVSGPAGIGKTALAIRWGHRVAERFPDGQLYINLRGFDPGRPMTASEALGQLLRFLDVDYHGIPEHVDEAAALYRGRLAGTRTLIVLDNAASAGQVRPLLPGSADCLVVVTSRNKMPGLVARDGAGHLSLEVLGESDALELLTRIVGRERIDSRSGAEVTRLCGRLPLALRIAAANIAMRPETAITDFVHHLSCDRLKALSVQDDPDSEIRAVFDHSYRALKPEAQRLFRLTGSFPGATFSVGAAAAIGEYSPEVAEGLLNQLCDVHLLVDQGAGRYTWHDLLRLYARGLATWDEPAASRLVDWYAGLADVTNQLISPRSRAVEPKEERTGDSVPSFKCTSDAIAFLDAESANFAPLLRFALEHEFLVPAWQIAYLLSGYFNHGRRLAEALATTRWGLVAAKRADDPNALRIMHATYAGICSLAQQPRRALPHLRAVIKLAREVGNGRSEAIAYNNLGRCLRQLGQLDDAVESYQRALRVRDESHDVQYVNAMVRNNIGHALIELGRPVEAASQLREALASFRRMDNPKGEALSAHGLGHLHLTLGEYQEARDHLEHALVTARRGFDHLVEFAALRDLAELYASTGDRSAAERTRFEVLALSREMNSPAHEAAAMTAIQSATQRQT